MAFSCRPTNSSPSEREFHFIIPDMQDLEPKISAAQAGSLHGLFTERVRLSGNVVAYRQHDARAAHWRTYTWRDVAAAVARCRRALLAQGLKAGERVAVMLPNGVDWVAFDQAILSLRLISVPIYSHDSAENAGYILDDSGARVLVIDAARFDKLQSQPQIIAPLQKVILLGGTRPAAADNVIAFDAHSDAPRDDPGADPGDDPGEDASRAAGAAPAPDDVATIVYTSGTTGSPKGVVLTHGAILANAAATSDFVSYIRSDNLFLSFLPLSHMFERTVGYYLSLMIGAEVAFARSVQQLKDDLLELRPTVFVSVPRIYEQVYGRLQAELARRPAAARWLFGAAVAVGWGRYSRSPAALAWRLLWPLFDALIASRFRRNLGGRLRYALSGGAALAPEINRTLTALGVPVYQGYGLTETGPVLSVNEAGGPPASIGLPLAEVEVRIGDNRELLTRSPYLLREYWQNAAATAQALDADGWLRTGDQARLDEHGRLYIIGRIKEIIVMANGEKVPPADVEHALLSDAWFAQAMVHGEGRPFLVALLVLADEMQARAAGTGAVVADAALEGEALRRVRARLSGAASYARVRRVILLREPWTVENGLLTPTLKLKRYRIGERFKEPLEKAYSGF